MKFECPIDLHTAVDNNPYIADATQKTVASAIVNNITRTVGETVTEGKYTERAIDSTRKFLAAIAEKYSSIASKDDFLTRDYSNNAIFKNAYDSYRSTGDNVAVAFVKAAVKAAYTKEKITSPNTHNFQKGDIVDYGLMNGGKYTKIGENLTISKVEGDKVYTVSPDGTRKVFDKNTVKHLTLKQIALPSAGLSEDLTFSKILEFLDKSNHPEPYSIREYAAREIAMRFNDKNKPIKLNSNAKEHITDINSKYFLAKEGEPSIDLDELLSDIIQSYSSLGNPNDIENSLDMNDLIDIIGSNTPKKILYNAVVDHFQGEDRAIEAMNQQLSDGSVIGNINGVKGENIAPKTSIPQNRVSGKYQYGFTQTARKEITDKLGENTTSIDMVEAGYRTRTTRSVTEAQKYNLSVGDIFEQYGVSKDGTTKRILTRVTAIYGKEDPRFLGNWNKEGWTNEGIEDIKRLKDGAQAIEFEVINQSKGENISSLLKEFNDFIDKNLPVFNSTVEVRTNLNIAEYTIKDGKFVNDFMSDSSVVTINNDELLEQIQELNPNDLVRTKHNGTIVTAYVKDIKTVMYNGVPSGIQIEFYSKSHIQVDETAYMNESILDSDYISNSKPLEIGESHLSSKQKLGSNKYAIRVNYVSGKIQDCIDAYVEEHSDDEKMKKAKTLPEMLNVIGFDNLMSQLKEVFRESANTPREDLVAQLANELVESEELSTEVALKKAEEIVDKRLIGWNEILDNWESISFDALTKWGRKNNVEIVINDDNTTSTKTKEKEDSDDVDSDDNFRDKENEEKESWQFDQANAHAFKSISQEMKDLLSMFPLLDANGMQVYDDMYEPVNISENRAYMRLQNLLLPADNFKEMLEILQENVESNPEYEELINFIEKDQEEGGKYQQLFFQLFNAQVQNFINFTQQNREEDGAFGTEISEVVSAIPLNSEEGVMSILENTMSNITSETKLSDTPLYSVTDTECRDNALQVRNAALDVLQNGELYEIKDKDIIEAGKYEEWLSNHQTDVENIFKGLLSLGFDINLEDYYARLTNYSISDIPIWTLADNISKIAYNVQTGKLLTEKNGGYNSGYLKEIARILNDNTVVVDRLATVRSDNKTYAQFKKPSYFSNLFKHLTLKNDAKRKEFIENEFGKYDWFRNKGNKDEIIENINKLLDNDSLDIDLRDELEGLLDNLNDNVDKDTINELLSNFNPDIQKQILGDAAGYIEDSWNNAIIEEFLTNANDVCDMFSHNIALSYEGNEYSKWTPEQYAKICLTQYFKRKDTSKSDFADFMVPILADATSAEFVTLKKRGSVEACIKGLYQVYKQELARISLVQERENMRRVAYEKYNKLIDKYNENRANGKKTKKPLLTGIPEYSCPIANFDIQDELEYDDSGKVKVIKSKNKQGSKLNFLSFMYNYTDSPLAFANDYSGFREIVEKELANEANKIASIVDLNQFAVTNGVNSKTYITKDELYEYCAETMYATAMIEEITITDLAQYKNAIDFQKRYKQVYASTARMDIYAKYGRVNERNIILKDAYVNRLSEEVRRTIENCKYFSKEQKKTLLEEFQNVNWADAQSYRSLSSYRAILSMSGQWDDSTFGVLFDKLTGKINEPVTAEELSLIMQTKKPFVFTSKSVASKVQGRSDMRVGFQVKNSEFLLLWAYSQMDLLGKERGGVIKALNQFMEDNNIDLVSFESAIKVGLQGAIDLSHINYRPSYKKIKSENPKQENESDEQYAKRIQEIYNKELVKSNQKNYSMTLSTLYAATGISQGKKGETYDQIEERVNNSLNPEIVHTIPYSEYGIITSTPEHYIDHKQRIGTQLLRLITADNDGTYNINGNEMDSEGVYKYLNNLLNAKMLNHFKKLQKKLTNNTDLEKYLLNQMRNNDRYSDSTIHSVHLNENGDFNLLGDPVVSSQIESLLNSLIRKEINEMQVEGGTCIQVTSAFAHDLHIKWRDVKDAQGKVVDRGIAYLECRLPFQFKDLYSKFMDENGMISVAKIYEQCDKETADHLLRLVGCRIPTESKHSIQHLKVVGFLPQNNGSAIMLPAEITKVAGSDFDVDKMFLYRYSFIINKEDNSIKYVRYNNTPIEQMNEMQLNNAIIDTIWSVLAAPQSAAQMLTPSDFAESKRWGYIGYLLNQPEYHNEICKQGKLNPENATAKDKYNYLTSISTDSLADILSMNTNRIGLSNQLRFFEANTKGKSLLGIMAVNSVSQAMFQHSTVSIDANLAFTLNGNKFSSLSNKTVKYSDGTEQLTTKYIQEWLAAAADNTKDPVLSYIGVSHELINAAIAMCRLGYPVKDISLFFNSPAVRRVKEKLKGKNFVDKFTVEKAIFDVLDETNDKIWTTLNANNGGNYENSNGNINLTTEDLLGETNKDCEILEVLMRLTIIGEDLNDLSSITRADSTSGNVSASMAGNLSKLFKQYSVKYKIDHNLSSLKGAYNMIKDISIPSTLAITDDVKKILMDALNESDLGYVQGQNTFALQSLYGFFYKKLPTFSPMVIEVCKSLGLTTNNGYLSEKQIKRVVNEYIKSMLYQIPFFGDEVISQKNKKTGKTENVLYTTKQKVEFFRDNMWNIITAVKSEYPEITNNKLIQSLKLKVAKEKKDEKGKLYKAGYDTVVLPNAGNITEEDKEAITNAWDELLNSPIDSIRRLGMDLIRYSFYRNGLTFSPDGFGHLAPNSRTLIDGYIEQVRNCNTNTNNEFTIRQFLTQFVKNNSDILSVGNANNAGQRKHPLQNGCFYTIGEGKEQQIAFLSYLRNAEVVEDTGEERQGYKLYKFNKPLSYDFNYYDKNDKREFAFAAWNKSIDMDSYLNKVASINATAKELEKSDNKMGVIERLQKETLSITNKTWC